MATLRETLSYTPVELNFGTSGLRGLVTDMTDLECYLNTAGFLRFLQTVDSLQPKATVYLGGDLRDSTPRILRAVHKAISDGGYTTVYCGILPTPGLAYYAGQKHAPCIMVTGSHIPEDRNGIKFYKSGGEVLKEDELGIKEAVAAVRTQMYATDIDKAGFTPDGMLTQPFEVPAKDSSALDAYLKRYSDVFDNKTLAGKKIVFYQHSCVGRDAFVDLLEQMGAEVVPVGRSDSFVPIDTENVTPDDQAYFKVLAKQHPDAFAIVSADGDADRPFVIDEHGVFHNGDVLGLVVADWLNADFACMPISASDAVDQHLAQRGVAWQHTRIGSPYVIVVMDEAMLSGHKRVVGWEVNGGFMLGSDFEINGKKLTALPTRDAIFPILAAMCAAIKNKQSVSQLFAALPQRFTSAGLLDNFPGDVWKKIADTYGRDDPDVYEKLAAFFTPDSGFDEITHVNSLDGVRIYFKNGDVAHLRQSNNAPQLRMYSVAGSQARADEIVKLAIAEPDGIFRRIQNSIAG